MPENLAFRECAQHGVHADGWILTAKLAFSWL
jgi:ubiquinone/menaquinone biosynthesis C-methylase UbiE